MGQGSGARAIGLGENRVSRGVIETVVITWPRWLGARTSRTVVVLLLDTPHTLPEIDFDSLAEWTARWAALDLCAATGPIASPLFPVALSKVNYSNLRNPDGGRFFISNYTSATKGSRSTVEMILGERAVKSVQLSSRGNPDAASCFIPPATRLFLH